jgi:hypothetical protein
LKGPAGIQGTAFTRTLIFSSGGVHVDKKGTEQKHGKEEGAREHKEEWLRGVTFTSGKSARITADGKDKDRISSLSRTLLLGCGGGGM